MTDDLLTKPDNTEEPGREIAERRPNGPLAAAPAAQMLDVIARAASDPRVDVAKMEALLRMQRELIADQAKAEFSRDFATMHPKLPRIPKRGMVDRGAGKGSFPYGKWETIDEMVRPLLDEHGFWLSFTAEPSPQGGAVITGTLHHRGGHEKTASIGPLPADNSGGKNPVQAAGSTFAYGKRYTTTMLLNLTFEGADEAVEATDDFIDGDQISEISRLLRETDSNVERFLRHFQIDQTSDLRQSQYREAMRMLKAKLGGDNAKNS